jgi:hypothetical protein
MDSGDVTGWCWHAAHYAESIMNTTMTLATSLLPKRVVENIGKNEMAKLLSTRCSLVKQGSDMKMHTKGELFTQGDQFIFVADVDPHGDVIWISTQEPDPKLPIITLSAYAEFFKHWKFIVVPHIRATLMMDGKVWRA